MEESHRQLPVLYELPRSPAPTMYGDGESQADALGFFECAPMDKVMGPRLDTYRPNNGQVELFTNPITPPLNTPPPTPHNITPNKLTSMPFLTELLSGNDPGHMTGYVLSIPCFLCQQPFNDIESLKAHLLLHMTQPPAPNHQASIGCGLCGRGVRSESELLDHYKRHHEHVNTKSTELPPIVPAKTAHAPTTRRPYKCSHCKKSYKTKGFLRIHMKIVHSTGASPIEPVQPKPKPMPTVWSTGVLNAVAAANYNPATESAAKYVADSGPRQLIVRSALPPPKRKYAPRSPFFNPDLWLPSTEYV